MLQYIRSGGYRTPGSRSGPGLGKVQIHKHNLTFPGEPLGDWFAVWLKNDGRSGGELRKRSVEERNRIRPPATPPLLDVIAKEHRLQLDKAGETPVFFREFIQSFAFRR